MRAVAGPDMAVLRTPVTLCGENFKTAAMFTIAKGETMPFVLSYGPSHLPVPEPVDPEAALEDCEKFWTDWTGATKTDGPHAEAIKRSLITLKALTYAPSGGIVAAPTTSLPEQAGGARNWDYRLLLDPRCDPHPARHDERRRLRRGDGVARLAAARRRRRSRRHADHVRHHGRAAADGMGGRLAAGLSRVQAGADRQRRLTSSSSSTSTAS